MHSTNLHASAGSETQHLVTCSTGKWDSIHNYMCSYRYACVNFKVSLCLHKFNFSNLPLSHASTLPHEHKMMSCFSFICQQSGLGSAQKLGLPEVRNVPSVHILLNICVSQATHFNYHYAICSRVMTNIKIRVHLNHWLCQHVNMNVAIRHIRSL